MAHSDYGAGVSRRIAPACPVQPIGSYDYFGKLLTPQQAWQLVTQNGLNPLDPNSYRKLGLVHITRDLIDRGRAIFFDHLIGDTFGLQKVFGFTSGFARILPEVIVAVRDLHGKPTTNLRIVLLKDLTLGSHTFPRGTALDTGLDVEPGALLHWVYDLKARRVRYAMSRSTTTAISSWVRPTRT